MPDITPYAICLCLMSCSTPDTISFSRPDPAAIVEDIYVVTQQTPGSDEAVFHSDRVTTTNHAKVSVSIPPSHMSGQIEWPKRRPDPLQDFAVVNFAPLDIGDRFNEAIASSPGDAVYLFVHGYNNTTSEALYRYAQIATDFDVPDTKVLFSWASAGAPTAYVYDRDSVLFARDELTALLTDITRKTDKHIYLMAHSMGAMLSMEAMRQLAIGNDDDVLQRIDVVTFISPDIDPDIFRAQAAVIGELPQPFVILTSGTDKALRMSSLLIGGREKVGEIGSADDVAGLNVTFIDLTNVSDGKNMDHMVAVTSPAAIQVLRRMIQQDVTRRSDLADYLVPVGGSSTQ